MSETTTQEKLYTRQEAADFLQVHFQTVTRWANEGKLNPIRVDGGHRRYKESELKAVMAGEAAGR
ncbi:helix-turn-helix domain-containing protein [Nonomuraea sp. PA05]|uniref:helix-turn-helix domain-containing protein n=1 Tax=Nonomuraea sp. PA05 TaxID=2604466 RepID=UPI0011D491AC|nr:helix-turn-helix domain-containing protein [Nonomuraea sp. PA05]TYB50268.1 helix-turn-helix domain-containing protein [Nonomuraea sp. PA05]